MKKHNTSIDKALAPCRSSQRCIPMRFRDTYFSKEQRFAIGQELESGRFYLSIPVSNGIVDYEEYFEISKSQFDGYPQNLPELAVLADKCRKRQCDHLLIQQPGRNRGIGC